MALAAANGSVRVRVGQLSSRARRRVVVTPSTERSDSTLRLRQWSLAGLDGVMFECVVRAASGRIL